MNEQKVIDCIIDFIDKSNCLPTTNQLAKALGVSASQIDTFKQENAKYAEFVKIRTRFTSSDSERKNGFGSFKAFYEWFLAQKDRCYYCGTSQKELDRLFADELVSSKKFGATLHIERKNANKGYNAQNCVLACALCNNAKSDMINEPNFQKYFANSVKEFVNDLLLGKITNQM